MFVRPCQGVPELCSYFKRLWQYEVFLLIKSHTLLFSTLNLFVHYFIRKLQPRLRQNPHYLPCFIIFTYTVHTIYINQDLGTPFASLEP